MAATKSLKVSFPTARELLNSYWGLLASGGLVVNAEHGLEAGDPVIVDIAIESSGSRCQLRGQVVQPASEMARRVVIAFNRGEPQDRLLDAAWAEIDNVPARRERRFPLDADVQFTHESGAGAIAGRLVNVSSGGCCLRVPRAHEGHRLRVGAPLTLFRAGCQLNGVVKWSDGSCRGIEFGSVDPAVVESFIRQFP